VHSPTRCVIAGVVAAILSASLAAEAGAPLPITVTRFCGRAVSDFLQSLSGR